MRLSIIYASQAELVNREGLDKLGLLSRFGRSDSHT